MRIRTIPVLLALSVRGLAAPVRTVRRAGVFFFGGAGDRYVREYGPGVQRSRTGGALELVNNPRAGGLVGVTTGPMRLVVQHGEPGFLRSVARNLDGDGFDEADVIANIRGTYARGILQPPWLTTAGTADSSR